MKLGNLEEVTKKANGQDSYVWAKNFVDELNNKRTKEKLKGLTPASYRNQSLLIS